MSDLFDFAADHRRQKLREAGCVQIDGELSWAIYWKLPDGRTVPEAEAFRWLESEEKTDG